MILMLEFMMMMMITILIMHIRKCPATWRTCIIGTYLPTKFHYVVLKWANNPCTSDVPAHFFLANLDPVLTMLRSSSSKSSCVINFLLKEIPAVRAGFEPGTSRSLSQQNCPPASSHVIRLTGTIFELKETNVLSKFHGNWVKNVTFYCVHIKMPRQLAAMFFSPIPTILKLVRDINKTNVLTNFHDDWANIVTSRVFTRENCHYIHIEKNAPPLAAMKTASPTGGHFFQRIGTTFELNHYIIKTNILTNFELGRYFIGTKLLTKFHEDGTRNVASRVFTSK
ncbi:hypothetical protein DPMN_024203 [Dreissena polymorpha]|uniref:Uncharacterized protein n=1 Tax=Dreissena polymorpha TaxID=45954 RepID=A0A9D4LNP2_DREPO|nr:hypothetical protein DPMN_024203 [Dreissena polymorpha]